MPYRKGLFSFASASKATASVALCVKRDGPHPRAPASHTFTIRGSGNSLQGFLVDVAEPQDNFVALLVLGWPLEGMAGGIATTAA